MYSSDLQIGQIVPSKSLRSPDEDHRLAARWETEARKGDGQAQVPGRVNC